MKYTALIIDIVNSKTLSKDNREELQFFIKQCLIILNRLFRPSIVFEVIFSAGDEVQGLFKNPYSAFMYYRLFKIILTPLRIRCGIGVGDWDVKIMYGTSSEQDGPAYHNAREAIWRAHQTPGSFALFNSNNDNDIYINTLLSASSLLMQGQSKLQSQLYLMTELMAPLIDENSMDLEALQDIMALIDNKENINFYLSVKSRNDNLYMYQFNGLIDSEPIHVFSHKDYNQKMILETTVKRGLSTKISSVTNTTRQNIDNILKKANVSAIRNIDLTTIIYIKNNI